MTDPSKIKASHLQRAAYVYIRQSTPGQVEHNRESTTRQYALADRACQLGWSKEQVVLIDEDLGLSGARDVGIEPLFQGSSGDVQSLPTRRHFDGIEVQI